MGLGGVDLSDEHGGDRTPFPVSCSICLEAVKESKDRSRAKLQCGHEFHLDCIGSAFNAKGVMQCPNCRKVEKGQWLYANGCRSFPEFGMDDWTHDEDVYDISYSEMPFGVQWCPFSGLARLTSFEEGESTTSTHNDVFGHHAIFSEHTSASSAAHSCPYVPYFQQVQISSSNSVDSVSDGPTFHRWSGLSGPSDVSTSHAFPAVDLNYPSWDHHSPPFSSNVSRMNGADQVPVSPGMLRSIRAESDGFPRNGAFAHPFFPGHGSTSRASSSAIPLVPPFLGGSRSHPRARLHSYGQPNSTAMRAPALSSTRRSTGPRVSAPASSVPSSSDHPGIYLISGSSGGNLPDTESNGGSRLYAWERDLLAPYPLAPPDSEQNWWGRFQQVPGGSDFGNRTGFWHRHSNERQSSQGRTESSYQPVHPPRMYPFI